MNTCFKKTDKAEIGITEEGHILIQILEDQELDLDDVIRINSAKDELVGKNRYTVIFCAPKFGNITLKAREFAASEACYRNAIAKAIVTNSISGKIIGNFFINFHKPPAPTKIFSTKKKAAAWLNIKRSESELLI